MHTLQLRLPMCSKIAVPSEDQSDVDETMDVSPGTVFDGLENEVVKVA